MHIRKLVQADAAQLRSLIVESAATVHADFDEHGWQTFLGPNTIEKTRQRLVDEDYYIYGADIDNKLVGMISIYQLEKIDQLFVLPPFFGRGIAKQLWQRALQATEAVEPQRDNRGYYWVRSSSYAVPVYQRFGFVAVGAQQRSNGIRFQLMEMQLKH